MIIYVSLLSAILGLVVFFASKTNGDLKAIGKDLWWIGWLVFLLQLPGSHIVSLFK